MPLISQQDLAPFRPRIVSVEHDGSMTDARARELAEKGHGVRVGSCGHVIGCCRCKDGGKIRVRLDKPCPNCLNAMPPRPKVTTRHFAGMKVRVENPVGSVRAGVGRDGRPWRTVMQNPYGFIGRTRGADDEAIDAYLGPNEHAPDVHVIHQDDPDTGRYDEDKVMIGFDSPEAAKAAYLAHYDRPGFYRSHTTIPIDRFRQMLSGAAPGSVRWKRKHKRELHAPALLSRAGQELQTSENPMAVKPNLTVIHRALGAASKGHVDHGPWSAPNASQRKAEDCAAMEGKALAYPLFAKGGKLSAAGVAAALGRARTNAPSLVPHLEEVDRAVQAQKAKAEAGAVNLDMADGDGGGGSDGIDLSRVVKCPHCKSYDVKREKTAAHAGPSDHCTRCGNRWAAKNGTLTMEQHEAKAKGEEGAAEPDGDDKGAMPQLASRFGQSLMTA